MLLLICFHRVYETPFNRASYYVLALSECMKVGEGEIYLQESKKVMGEVSKTSGGDGARPFIRQHFRIFGDLST